VTALDHERKVRNLVRAITESDEISDHNRQLILEFKRDMSLNDVSDAWIQNLLSRLKIMAQAAEFDLDHAEREDVKTLIEAIKQRPITPRTVVDYKKALKRFYSWLHDGEYPDSVSWMKTTDNTRNHTLPEDVLTETDIEKMLQTTTSTRTRALIAILWETGARIGEIIDLKINDLRDHPHGLQIVIKGKTGSRRLPLISSVPEVRAWLNQHPTPNNRDAPLWAKYQQEGKGQRISYRYILKSLRKASRGAAIKKPANPHHYRHSRATYLASRFTEAQLCEWFGWVQGSSVPAKYVHMSGRDIDDSYAQLHGLETETEPRKAKLAPTKCPRCSETNPPRASYCQRCGQALNLEAAQKIEQNEQQLVEKLAHNTDQELMDMLKFTTQLYKLAQTDPEIAKRIKTIQQQNQQ
jgi:site-specific recombinase XerD/ribosomal protein L40E